jgi:hypothetical protein
MFKIVRDAMGVPNLMNCCDFRRCRRGRHCLRLLSRWCCGLWGLWGGDRGLGWGVRGILEGVRRSLKHAVEGVLDDLLRILAWGRS